MRGFPSSLNSFDFCLRASNTSGVNPGLPSMAVYQYLRVLTDGKLRPNVERTYSYAFGE